MDSLIFELQIVFYFQLFLSANVRHTNACCFLMQIMQLLLNISPTKKEEFTLSSKTNKAACLFLFSGSVSKLSFDRIIIDEVCNFFSFSFK